MRCVTRSVIKTAALVGAIFCLCCLTAVQTKVQNPVIATLGSTASLTIIIPDNQEAKTASYILIRLDGGIGSDQKEVVFLMNNGPRIKETYESRLSVTQTGNKVDMLLRNVSATDAGVYRCFSASGISIIPNCGQLLIVIRKPNPPSITILPSSTALVGSNLHLVCETHSTSLPPNHGLTSERFWYDHRGKAINPSLIKERIHINTEGQLVIEDLKWTDSDLKFYCTSADSTDSVAKRRLSDASDIFVVVPEYKPTSADIKLTPQVEMYEVLKKRIGEQVTYRCEAQCSPQCETVWMYRPYGGASGYGLVMNLIDKRILSLDMSRISEGSYRCQAENKHGVAIKEFYLNALYISGPVVHINGEQKSSARFVEDVEVNLSCDFDSNPGPVVIWSSPSRNILSTKWAMGLKESLASNGVYMRPYTSYHTLSHLKCEDSGVYMCEGRNNISTAEGIIDLMIMCPPSSASIPGLDLQTEYVWDISQSLVINFVIRALPVPVISKIMSSVNGQVRKEEIPRDFVFSKSIGYEGKPYLTKFTLTSRRNLDQRDEDRRFIVTIESSEFIKNFLFKIQLRGSPRKVFNLTVTNVGHDSVTISWIPGFNGGEVQTFSVGVLVLSPAEHTSNSKQLTDEQEWATFMEGIPDLPTGQVVDVQLGSLKSSTEYIVRVTAVNKLGTSVTEIQIKTAEAPPERLGAGPIVGIVIATLILICLLAMIFLCVFRRRCGQDNEDDNGNKTSETEKPMIPARVFAWLRQDKKASKKKADDIGPVDNKGDDDRGDDKCDDDGETEEQVHTPMIKTLLEHEERNEKHVKFQPEAV